MISHYISDSCKPSVLDSAAVLFCFPLILGGGGKNNPRGEMDLLEAHSKAARKLAESKGLLLC